MRVLGFLGQPPQAQKYIELRLLTQQLFQALRSTLEQLLGLTRGFLNSLSLQARFFQQHLSLEALLEGMKERLKTHITAEMFLEQKQGELLEITRARFRDVITLELLEQKKAALSTRKPRAKFQTLPIFQQRRLLQYILELPTKHISKA